MAKTLLEVFTEPKKKRSKNRSARSKGNQAESLLVRQLTQMGFEVRRTHLSLFPDIIAWNESTVVMIEVKARTPSKVAVSNALSSFRHGVRALSSLNRAVELLCYIRMDRKWVAYKWQDGKTVEAIPFQFE
jgi:predicted transcriptional regulator